MIRIRGLLACSFLAVLVGCTDNPCSAPDKLSNDPNITCLYQIEVISKDADTNSVTGKVPNVLVFYNKSEKKDEPFETPKSTSSEDKYTFRVSHFEKLSDLIVTEHTYEFMRVGNYPEFGLGKEIIHMPKK